VALSFVCGRAKSGKSEYIYNRIRELANAGEEVMLIVPEQYTHAAERKLLGVVDAIKDNSVEVFSFGRLATETEKRLGYPYVEKIDSVGKILTIEEILKENDFKFYKDIKAKSGFLELISDTIGEFKKYMLLPDTLSELSDKTDNELLAIKLKELSVIYSQYEKMIENRFSDSGDSLTILAKRLTESDIYKNKYVFLDEFSTFVPQETGVIDALCNSSKEVCISLCCDMSSENSSLFMPTLDTLRRFKDKNPVIKNIDGTHFSSEELKFLEKNLYRFPAEKFGRKCENIRIFSANNPYSEAEYVAVEILSLVRDKKMRFRDIAIICSDVETYEMHIERIFASYNIPYFIDTKRQVLNHHIIRYVLSLIEVYTNDYSYESIFNYLKTAFVDADPDHICIMENYILKTRLRRSTWLDDEKWQKLLDAFYNDNEKAKRILNEIRTKYILPLAKMHEEIKGRNLVSHDVSKLYNLIVELRLSDTISSYIDMFTKMGEVRLAKEYEQVWDILTNTLDELVYICGERKVSPEEFLNLLYTAFSQHKIGYIPSTVDRVLVGNTERTRADGIKALFVLGVNEGIFPVPPKADGVLSDRDKENMKEKGVEFSTTSTVAAYYSQFALYSAFTMPSHKLFISYSKAGNDFKSMRKSYIISRVSKLLSISEENENNTEDASRYINSQLACREYLSDAMADYINGNEVLPIWKNVYNYFSENTSFLSETERFIDADNIAHRLSEKNLSSLLPILSHTSVSKIQRYTACHYAYFMDYILKVNKPKEEVVDSLDIGNISHGILEALCKEISSSGIAFKDVDDSKIAGRIDEMLGEFIDNMSSISDEFSKRDKYIIERLKRSVFLCFKAIKKHISESMFEPLGYEMEFSDESPLGSIKIETADGKTVNITGKIDRADAYKTENGTFIRVIDYKTGNKTFRLDDIFYGLDVQLIVYMNALVNSNSSYNYGGALYFLIDDPVVKAQNHISDDSVKELLESSLNLKGIIVKDDVVLNGYDSKTAAIRNKFELEKFELIDKYLNKLLSKICTDMTNGDISIKPYKKGSFSPCAYCKYASVCRFDPAEKSNSYNHLEDVGKADEVFVRMEEQVNVD